MAQSETIEELAKASDSWSKDVFKAGPQKLVGEYRQSTSLTTVPTPHKTETITVKDWPGDWKKTESAVESQIRKGDTVKYQPRFVVSVKWWKI